MAGSRSRLYNSTGFFFLLWAAHYLPFFIMGRQLFLHHYLPAHLASALVAGAVVEFVFNIEPPELEAFAKTQISNATKQNPASTVASGKTITGRPRSESKPIREKIAGQNFLATWAAAGVVIAVLVWGFWFFAPLTYGKPGLSVEQVNARKWLNYDLHFAK